MVTEPQILSSFSPRACPRCMLTCFLSLPPMLAHLLFCRGPGIYAHLLFCRGSRWRLPISADPPSVLYICREPSTNHLLFMQNKPNFQNAQMNINSLITKDYENKWQRRVRKNKPNSNPIKPNFKKAQMNVNSLITKDYRKKDDFTVRINKPNFQNGQNERKRFFTKGL